MKNVLRKIIHDLEHMGQMVDQDSNKRYDLNGDLIYHEDITEMHQLVQKIDKLFRKIQGYE